MSRHSQRHIALRIAYLGEHYQGLAMQENTSATIESVLFTALQKTCLVTDRTACEYSRCGRTDKGVSALGQVVAMNMRSVAAPSDPGATQETNGLLPSTASSSNPKAEMDYVKILNRVLPDDVRVLAWAAAPAGFSARFSCTGRTYKYFFVKSHYDIGRMRCAASHLVGEHDFRNFCKMDVIHVSNYVRAIRAFTIEPCGDTPEEDPLGLWVATVHGTAFLYHQVRCMMQVLFEVAAGNEGPGVVLDLLNIDKVSSKPQYPMASEAGLILWDCQFPDLQWNSTVDAQRLLVQRFLQSYEERAVRLALARGLLTHVTRDFLFSELQTGDGTLHNTRWGDVPEEATAPAKRRHVPLLDRQTENSFAERVEGLSAAKRAKRERNLRRGDAGALTDPHPGQADPTEARPEGEAAPPPPPPSADPPAPMAPDGN